MTRFPLILFALSTATLMLVPAGLVWWSGTGGESSDSYDAFDEHDSSTFGLLWTVGSNVQPGEQTFLKYTYYTILLGSSRLPPYTITDYQ